MGGRGGRGGVWENYCKEFGIIDEMQRKKGPDRGDLLAKSPVQATFPLFA